MDLFRRIKRSDIFSWECLALGFSPLSLFLYFKFKCGSRGLDYNFNRGNNCQGNLLQIIDLIQMTCKITTSTNYDIYF